MARTHARYALLTLVGLLLAACSQPATSPIAPMNQQEVGKTVSELAFDLTPLFNAVENDLGVVALGQFPYSPGLPFGAGDEVPPPPPEEAFSAALRALTAILPLPRGVYTYDADTLRWTQAADADVLSLTWPYDPNDGGETALSTLTLDWAAGAPTAQVRTPEGEQVEAPTSLNVSLVADGVTAADVTVALDYYTADACGGSILEPTRVAVDGSGTLLTFDNVGYSVREGDGQNTPDTVTTQGRVTLAADADALTLGWEVAVDGTLTRAPCFSSSFVPQSGTVATTLDANLGGEARSATFGLEFGEIDETDGSLTLSGGYLTLDSDAALTFAGRLDDRNGNGVPGEGVGITFADGSSTTLERVLLGLEQGMSALGLLGRLR